MAAGAPNPHRLGRLDNADVYTAMESASDQTGVGAVLNFVLTARAHMIFVHSRVYTSRMIVGAQTPSAILGGYCLADTIVPFPIEVPAGTLIKVFAPAGAVVSVWGMSYT